MSSQVTMHALKDFLLNACHARNECSNRCLAAGKSRQLCQLDCSALAPTLLFMLSMLIVLPNVLYPAQPIVLLLIPGCWTLLTCSNWHCTCHAALTSIVANTLPIAPIRLGLVTSVEKRYRTDTHLNKARRSPTPTTAKGKPCVRTRRHECERRKSDYAIAASCETLSI